MNYVPVLLQVAKYTDIAPTVKPLVADTVEYINDAYDSGKRILIEGANATMLDLDFGTYPYVTSSNPSIGGIATGLGLAPNKYSALIGVVSPWERGGGGEVWVGSLPLVSSSYFWGGAGGKAIVLRHLCPHYFHTTFTQCPHPPPGQGVYHSCRCWALPHRDLW